MWWIAVKVVLAIIGLYIATAAVFMASARLKKDSNGNLILDPESWHFKTTFPMRKFDVYKVKDLSGSISLCGYFYRFFMMLFLGWPFILIWAIAKTILYSPFMILFGYYPVADLRSMYEMANDYGPFGVKVEQIYLPRIYGYRIFPIYLIVPTVYWICWKFWPITTIQVSIWTAELILGVIVFRLLVSLFKFGEINLEVQLLTNVQCLLLKMICQ